jgi:hypothetical protein
MDRTAGQFRLAAEKLTNPVSGSAYPDADERITREVLGLRPDLAWRIMLTLGAVPALQSSGCGGACGRPRGSCSPRPRPPEQLSRPPGQPSRPGSVACWPSHGLLRWLAGASLAWLLFDFAQYGNTISS